MSGAGRWPVASSDEDFTEFLSGAPPAAARMFWRFIGLARDCGAVTFELQRSRVVLRGSKRIFASVRVSARGLAGHVNLARGIPPGGLIRKVEPLTKTLYFHAFAVSPSTTWMPRSPFSCAKHATWATAGLRRIDPGPQVPASRSSKSPLPKAATARSPVSGSLPEAAGASLAAQVLSDGAIRPDDL